MPYSSYLCTTLTRSWYNSLWPSTFCLQDTSAPEVQITSQQ